MKILVPYDGSVRSEEALKYAVELSGMLKKKVHLILLNVVEKIYFPWPPGGGLTVPREVAIDRENYIKQIYFDTGTAASKMLLTRAGEIGTTGGEVRTKVLYGYPAEKIVDYAKAEKVDLIIMGNIGLSGISKVKVIGSVSRNVAERARCPVMIVH